MSSLSCVPFFALSTRTESENHSCKNEAREAQIELKMTKEHEYEMKVDTSDFN